MCLCCPETEEGPPKHAPLITAGEVALTSLDSITTDFSSESRPIQKPSVIGRFLDSLRLPESLLMHDLDNPKNQDLIRRIFRRKSFLRAVYLHFYSQLLCRVPKNQSIVEIGSGVGFFQQVCPQAIATDILPYRGLDLCLSGMQLPFQSESVGSYVMVDVFHHIPDPKRFLTEMGRCLQPSGRIVMIEPANTLFSRFIYTRFHHENFDPSPADSCGECSGNSPKGWLLPPGGPLSSANMALPWIVFCRDQDRFSRECPGLKVLEIKLMAPFQYIISGGLSLRQLLPGRAWPLVNELEKSLSPLLPWLAMFMVVVLGHRDD